MRSFSNRRLAVEFCPLLSGDCADNQDWGRTTALALWLDDGSLTPASASDDRQGQLVAWKPPRASKKEL